MQPKNLQPNYVVSFVQAIYHKSKHFSTCVGMCAYDNTPLLIGPDNVALTEPKHCAKDCT